MAESLYSEEATSDIDTPLEKTKKTSGSLAKDKEPTLLDKLTKSIEAEVRRKDVYINVPERPNVAIKISPNISQGQVRRWRKDAGEDTKNGMDATKFAAFVIGHTTEGILFSNEEVKDEEFSFDEEFEDEDDFDDEEAEEEFDEGDDY